MGALLMLAVAAEPVKIFVAPDPANGDPALSDVCVQALAGELRRYGLAVTSNTELAALAAGKRHEQIIGCEDKQCGLDDQILKTAEVSAHCLVSGDDDLFVMVKLLDMKQSDPTRLSLGTHDVRTSRRGLAGDMRDATVEVIALLRKRFGERVAAEPLKEGPGAPPAPRRCSVTGGCLVPLAVLILRRRRAVARP